MLGRGCPDAIHLSSALSSPTLYVALYNSCTRGLLIVHIVIKILRRKKSLKLLLRYKTLDLFKEIFYNFGGFLTKKLKVLFLFLGS